MQLRIAVLNPWGRSGSYGGPVVLSRVLFPAVARHSQVVIDTFTWAGSANGQPEWAARDHPVPKRVGLLPGDLAGLAWGIWVGLQLRLMRRRFDVVHLHGTYLPNLVAARVSGLKGRRFALLPVLEAGDLRQDKRLKRRILQWLMRRTLIAFALSEGISAELVDSGLEMGRIVRLGNPVPVSRFPGRAIPADSKNKLRVGFIGKVGPVKRPDLVLRAVAQLARQGVDVTAVVAGPFADGDYEEMICSLRQALSIESRVELLGFVPDVVPLLREAIDVLALPSSAEGMPGALAEAMVAGVPAVVTDVGAMGEHVRAANAGFVIRPDLDAITAALAALAADPARRQKMGQNAREYGLSTFGDDAVAELYLSGITTAAREDLIAGLALPERNRA